jgi:hypothetical protein
MSTICGSSSVFSRIAYDNAAVGAFSEFTSADPAFPLADGGSSLGLKQPHVNNSGMNGSTAQASEQTRPGLKLVDGDINLLATPDLLTLFLPHVTGRAMSSNVTYPSPDVPAPFHILLHRDSSLYTYTDLHVNKFTIGSDAGAPVKMTLGCVGKDREATPEAGTNWPAGLAVSNKAPYMHQDCVITVGGTAYKFKTWQLDIDNKLIPQYFTGTVLPCGFLRGDLVTTTLKLVGPHTQATVAALMHAATPPAALNVVITLTHPTAGMSLIIRCQALQIPIQDPPVGKGVIMLDLTGVARTLDGGSSGGAEVIFTNDSVPT